jgi:hypothetical protein
MRPTLSVRNAIKAVEDAHAAVQGHIERCRKRKAAIERAKEAFLKATAAYEKADAYLSKEESALLFTIYGERASGVDFGNFS